MNVVPDVTQASGLFWATVFGAAVGVVAGTIIRYLLTLALIDEPGTDNGSG